MAPSLNEDQTKRFEPLYEAIAQLTPRQRHNLAKQYGVGEINPAFTGWQGLTPYVQDKLRKALEPHLKQMLSSEQEE